MTTLDRTTQNYAALATASYETCGGNEVAGYTRLARYETNNDTSGFHGSVFTNGNEVVIAYEGTTRKRDAIFGFFKSFWSNYDQSGDSGSNAAMLRNELPMQYQDALDLYRRVQSDKAFEGKKIVIVGHSLGGGLAELVASTRDKEGNVPKIEAITFNAMGTKAIIDKPNDNIEELGNTRNYVVDSDIIAHIQEQPGSTVAVEGTKFDKHTMHNFFDAKKSVAKEVRVAASKPHRSFDTRSAQVQENPIKSMFKTAVHAVSSFFKNLTGKQVCSA